MSYLYSKLPETGVSPHIGTGGGSGGHLQNRLLGRQALRFRLGRTIRIRLGRTITSTNEAQLTPNAVLLIRFSLSLIFPSLFVDGSLVRTGRRAASLVGRVTGPAVGSTRLTSARP